MVLLERAEVLEQAAEALARARAGRGSVLLLSGEAGIGKTRLISALLAAEQGGRLRVLQGRCEDGLAPEPLGPLQEMVAAAPGLARVQSLLERQAGVADVAAALLEALAMPHQPTLLIVEDLHWADDATLDLLRHLARRIARLPVLLVLSCRDDALAADHALARLLGELPAEVCDRVALRRLSAQAVAALCGAAGWSAAGVFELTGGQPFFTAELLACPEPEARAAMPATSDAAAWLRLGGLTAEGRELLETLCVVPGAVSQAQIEALWPGAEPLLRACEAARALQCRGDRWAFRHELVRQALLTRLSPGQQRLHHAAWLDAGLRSAQRGAGVGALARLAHHAAEAGDAERLLDLAPRAAAQASAVGAHGQAAVLLGAALLVAGTAAPALQAQLQESWAEAAGREPGQAAEVIAARHRALVLWQRAGRIDKVAMNLRCLSRLHWLQGEAALAEQHAAQAVELLQQRPPGEELAWAYANRAQLHLLQDRFEPARLWGERAIALATRLGQREVLSHALNTVGSAQLFAGSNEGEAQLERSLQLALQAGFHEQVARAYCNGAEHAVVFKAFDRAQRWLTDGVAYVRRFDLDVWTAYLLGLQAQLRLKQGRLDEALALAAEVLALPRLSTVMTLPALSVRVLVGLRRGRPEAEAMADEALTIALASQQRHRILPLLLARAEAAWLTGDVAAARSWLTREATQPLGVGLDTNPWSAGALAVWRVRLGEPADLANERVATPWLLELQGQAAAAAQQWLALGLPYEAAMARLQQAIQGDEPQTALDDARRLLTPLGVRPALQAGQALAQRLGLRWAEVGDAGAMPGPRELTPHEHEVLALLAQGLGNADIASRLGLGRRTVERHVSTVLVKLGAQGRSQAVTMAWRDQPR